MLFQNPDESSNLQQIGGLVSEGLEQHAGLRVVKSQEPLLLVWASPSENLDP